MTNTAFAGTLSSRLRLKHLELFANVMRHQTLRHAAELTNMTQPAATKLIQELEDMFSVPLFHRSKRGMKPTLYAEVMRRHVAVLLVDLSRLKQELSLVAQGGTGHIRLGVLPSLAPGLLTRSVRQMLAIHPTTLFSIQEASSTELLARLRRNDLDATFARILDADVAREVHYVPIYNETFAIVARKGHPLAQSRRSPSWRSLSEASWVLPARETPVRDLLDQCFINHAVFRPTAMVECTTLEKVRDLIAGSDMIGILPRSFLSSRHAQALTTLNREFGADLAPINLVFRRHDEMPPSLRVFAAIVQAAAKSLHLS